MTEALATVADAVGGQQGDRLEAVVAVGRDASDDLVRATGAAS